MERYYAKEGKVFRSKIDGAYLSNVIILGKNDSLDNYEEVPYFQATGLNYDFDDVSEIKVKTASGNTIDIKGVVGVMFDRDAVAVCNFNRRTTSKWNAKAEFTNYWYKVDAEYINDLNENCVVFFIQ